MSLESLARELPSYNVGPMRVSLGRRSFVVAGLVVFFFSVIVGVAEAFYLLYLLVLLFVVAYLWTRWSTESLTFTRWLGTDQIQVGEAVEEYFELGNQGRLPLLWAQIDDFSDLPGYDGNRVEVVGRDEIRAWKNPAVCSRRGLFRLGPARLQTGDPFGLFRAETELPFSRQVLVFPPLISLPEIELPLGLLQGEARSSLGTPLFTSTVAGVRDYRPGDPRSRIAWRQSARTRRLMVKESEMEPSGSLWVVIDLDRQVQVGSGEESSLELGIIVAASLAQRALQEGRAVGLLAGAGRIQPGKGGEQLRGILETLAMAEAMDGPPLADILRAMRPVLGRGRSLVIITPSTRGEWLEEVARLANQGLAPVVVLLTPPTGEKRESSREETGGEEMQGRLAWLGFPCFALAADRRLSPASQRRRPAERRYRTLGTGGAATYRRGL